MSISSTAKALRISQILKQAIEDEASVLLDFAANLPPSMIQAIDFINSKNQSRVVCTGMGKSGHIASKVCATLISTGTPSQFLHPAEALHGDLGMILNNDIILAFSNSGETEEILRLLPYFKENSLPIISIVGNSRSTLGKHSEFSISYRIEREACPHNLAPTSSTTLALAIGDALAIGLMHGKSFSPIDFARFHPAGSLGKKLLGRVSDYLSNCPSIAPEDSLMSVIHTMIEHKALLGVVINNKAIVGAISLGDLVRKISFAEENALNLNTLTAIDCMCSTPAVVDSDTTCCIADQIMNDNKINSLIVVNKHGDLLGLYSA